MKTFPSSHRSGRLLTIAGLLLASMAGFWPAAVSAQNCETDGSCGFMACKTPARPVPSALWGEIEPADPNPLPLSRDNTDFNEFGGGPSNVYGPTNPFWMSLDIDAGFLYSAISHGIQIWDLRTTPANPTFVKTVSGPGTLRFWSAGELKLPLRDIDIEGNLGAIAGKGNIGIALFDFTDRAQPLFLYQDNLKHGDQVYAATLGGRSYAFLASVQSSQASRPAGVLIYDMTAARAFRGCLDSAEGCPGVFKGRLGARTSAAFVDGVDNYVVLSSGTGRGFEIWDVANPSSPVQKLSALTGPTGSSVYGVAMWKSGSKYYLGLRGDSDGRIYDVSCITGGSCSLGSPVWSMPMVGGTPEFYVTYSSGGGLSYLYFGSDNKCGSGPPDLQREYLIDVTNPNQAHDLTPAHTVPFTGVQTSYWSWYYRKNPTGFNQIMPRMGKFNGEYFYRAAHSILDIHKRAGGVPPTVDFTWTPAEVYPGTQVDFTDQSTGAPTSWAWTFLPDGNPAASTDRNPADVTFAIPGPKSVTLVATNGTGPGSRTKTLTVLDPAPVVAGVTMSPPNPIVCQPITFTATGVTGQPPLTFGWQVTTRPGGLPAANGSGSGNPFVWNTTGGLSGDYTATVTVTNSNGNTVKSLDFTLGPLAQLPSSFAPTADPFVAGTVQFHVVAAGATEWNWDFGDGLGFTGWTSDPVAGPNPLHTYATTGQKTVVVKIRNCVEAERTSTPLVINVTQTTPLHAEFRSSNIACFGITGCVADQGQAVTFTDSSTGAVTWDYDWDGNGSYEDAGNAAPVLSHTYNAVGTFRPKLKVKRGSEENVWTHFANITVGTAAPPSITVSGPGSGHPGQALAYGATTANCTANATGWTWSASGGGVVSGATNSSTVTITWATTGNKTVSASNSGCGGASDSHSVSIATEPDPGGGVLAAAFFFTPTNPAVGQSVSFDASASTGSPVSYAWEFGDGQSGSGRTISHAYAAQGTFTIRLTITKPGTGPGCLFGTCVSELTRAIVVGPPAPPPFDVEFTTTATCVSQFGLDQCEAQTGVEVGFTSTGPGATSWSWSFGDGTAAVTGPTATHAWAEPGVYTVVLTVGNGTITKSKSRVFQVTGEPVAGARTVVLPWIAQTRGVIRQSSDLYVHNPGGAPIDVTLKFLRRGAPEQNPPQASRTVAPGATLFFADVIDELFDRENAVGFVTVTVDDGNVDPVLLSFNTTFQNDGSKFGQTVPGVSMSSTGAPANTRDPGFQHLIGLNDNGERSAYFGVSNPTDTPTVYHLRFFDKEGLQIGESADLTVGRFAQKQFQIREIREFGVSHQDDYRVEVETKSGGPLLPYGANLRSATEDPSFVGVDNSNSSKLYLVGALSQPGLNNSLWQTDVVLSNTSEAVISTDMTFIAAGLGSRPEATVRLSLQPGESRRLADVIGEEWNLRTTVGVLTFQSTTPGGVFPLIQGESYDNAHPATRFGQSMAPQSDADAAVAGKSQYIVGLRHNADYRTTLWLFNPSDQAGKYDLVYRRLDGSVIGRLPNLPLGAGKMRQVRPSDHPAGVDGVEGGFTVQVVVQAGKVIAAGQVINNRTNDPAYIRGESR